MDQTTEIRRSDSGAIDTEFYARNARALRSEAIRGGASSFAHFIERRSKVWKFWRMPAPEFPTHFAGPAE